MSADTTFSTDPTPANTSNTATLSDASGGAAGRGSIPGLLNDHQGALGGVVASAPPRPAAAGVTERSGVVGVRGGRIGRERGVCAHLLHFLSQAVFSDFGFWASAYSRWAVTSRS